MSAGRRLGLDVLKGVAILLVVFNHALVWPMRAGDRPSAFAYGIAFGTVAAFAAVAGYVQGLHPPREERAVVTRRAAQLLVPWALWAPVYAAVPFVWRGLGGGSVPVGLEPWPWARAILLGGGPLWFLTVLFAATAVCALADTRTSGWWPAFVALGAYATLAIVCGMAGTSPLEFGAGTFWGVAPLYVAAFWFGLRVARGAPPTVSHGLLATIVVSSLVAGGFVTWLRAVQPDARWLMWLPYAIGLLGGCAALLIAVTPGPLTRSAGRSVRIARMFARWGRASLGIYVLHPVLVAPAALLAAGRGGVWVAGLIALGCVALGTLAVERLRDVSVLRRVV